MTLSEFLTALTTLSSLLLIIASMLMISKSPNKTMVLLPLKTPSKRVYRKTIRPE
jgi:hypothetical protein